MRTSVFSILLAGLGLVAAIPNELAVERPYLEERAVTITAAELDQIKYVKQFASAAYCNSEDKFVGKKTTCSSNACPDLTAGNVVTYAHLNTEIGIRTDGAIFIDHTRRNIVLAFKGSKTIQSYLIDLDFTASTADDICTGCKLHYGISSIWYEVRGRVATAITNARAANPGYNVIFTGHSSGAGAATIGAVALRRTLNIPITLISFGSPRLGNEVWANYATNQGSTPGNRNYRVTHYDDIAAGLPPSSWGFYHVSPEYWLSRKDASTTDYPLNLVQVCEGTNPSGCRASTGFTLSGTAHGQYFGKISACYD